MHMLHRFVLGAALSVLPAARPSSRRSSLKTIRWIVLSGFAGLLVTPAFALDREFGSVNIAAGHYTDVRWSLFGGPLDHFTIMPENDAIDCEHITINYRDGTSHDVFSGYVAAGAHTTISLPPPNDGEVHDVTFACKAQKMDGARVALLAVTDSWPRGWDTERPVHVITEAGPR